MKIMKQLRAPVQAKQRQRTTCTMTNNGEIIDNGIYIPVGSLKTHLKNTGYCYPLACLYRCEAITKCLKLIQIHSFQRQAQNQDPQAMLILVALGTRLLFYEVWILSPPGEFPLVECFLFLDIQFSCVSLVHFWQIWLITHAD